MKLALRYQHRNIPVEIEIEGAALTPDIIPSILGSILKQLESWLHEITLNQNVAGVGIGVDPRQAQPQGIEEACDESRLAHASSNQLPKCSNGGNQHGQKHS